MAQKTIVSLIDDLDGGEAHESLTFGLDGVEYNIDLSEANAKKLRSAFATFLPHARRIGRRSAGTTASSSQSKRSTTELARTREMNNTIRRWAQENNLKVSDRGRIPIEVVERYQEAHAALF